MDYSIYDAIRAGFKKVVFIIRKDFADDFKNIFEPKLKGKVEIGYVFQDLHSFTGSYPVPAGRTKPWGTAHAVLCAKDAIKEPFAVINADDFYGRDAFEKAYAFLTKDVSPKLYCIIGYELAKTLSDNGTVSRGVCQVDAAGNLVSIAERTKIYQDGDKITYEEGDRKFEVPFDSKVSMNFWGFDPSVFDYTEKIFGEFLQEQGLVHRLESKSAFVGCIAEEDHDHAAQFLICRTCGKVTELEDHELAHALEDAAKRLGFKVGKATIEAEGQCATCAGS